MIRVFGTLVLCVALAGCRDTKIPASATMAGLVACDTLVRADEAGGGRVQALSVGPEGALAWSDGTPELGVLVSRLGEAPVRVGRGGSGPGEFRRIAQTGWLGDTLWVSDPALRRVQLFSPDGTVARIMTVTERGRWVPVGGDTLAGILGGALADPAWTVVKQRSGSSTADTLIRFVGPTAARLDIPSGGGGSIIGFQPLAERAVEGGAPDGSLWCGTVPIGEQPAVRLRCISSSGEPLVDTTVATPLRPVNDADYAAEVDAFATSLPNVPRGAIERAVTRPAHHPRVRSMVVGNDAGIWLGRHTRLDTTAVWLRFHRAGEFIGELRLPQDRRVAWIEEDYVYVAVADSDGLERLEQCALSGPPQLREESAVRN